MLTTTSSLFLPKTERFNIFFRFSEGGKRPEDDNDDDVRFCKGRFAGCFDSGAGF